MLRYLLLLPLFAFSQMITVDLKNPVYQNGILYTTQGGVIENEEIRIQAQSIQYIRRKEKGKDVMRIEAEGDLLIQYKGKVFVGSELEYDFLTKTGIVYDGKTFSSLWYIGGDEIELKADGSYHVRGAFITTCENKDSSWDIHAKRVNLFQKDLLEAQKLRFRFFKWPLIWLPSLKLNLRRFKEPFLRYQFNWDKGPLAGVRYQFYSWESLALYARAEWRWSAGWGGAFESEFLPEHLPIQWITRSYAGTNRLQNAPDVKFRYRLQGTLFSDPSENTDLTLTWDKYSDVRMPSDFKSLDFELNTAKKTIFDLHHRQPSFLTYLKARPRLNSFESLSQHLPTLYFTTLGELSSPIPLFSSFSFKTSYLRFAYSDQLTSSLQDFASARIFAQESLFSPIFLGPLTLTPHLDALAILYTNSPSSKKKIVRALSYGIDLKAKAKKRFDSCLHMIEPYLSLSSLTQPGVLPDDHFIFSIQDGYSHINELKTGVRSLFFALDKSSIPFFSSDLYMYGFFSDPTIPQFFPRLYLDLDFHFPSLIFTFQNAWNFRHNTYEYSNSRLLWTLNEHCALALEARYRSQYNWRKANPKNFILDVTRQESELLSSPLSDQRATLLTHFFIRFNPFWECHFQSHHGFFRKNQKPYNELKMDLFTSLSAACKLRLTLTRVAKYNKIRPSIGLSFYK